MSKCSDVQIVLENLRATSKPYRTHTLMECVKTDPAFIQWHLVYPTDEYHTDTWFPERIAVSGAKCNHLGWSPLPTNPNSTFWLLHNICNQEHCVIYYKDWLWVLFKLRLIAHLLTLSGKNGTKTYTIAKYAAIFNDIQWARSWWRHIRLFC